MGISAIEKKVNFRDGAVLRRFIAVVMRFSFRKNGLEMRQHRFCTMARFGKNLNAMKSKSILFTMAVLTGLLAWQGCKDKDIPEIPLDLSDIVSTPVEQDPMTWEEDNGRLVFIDDNHLSQGLRILSAMDDSTRVAFENTLGFRSASAQIYLISKEEERLEQIYYGSTPESFSVAQLDSAGKGNYVPGPSYQAAILSGLIREIQEADSSKYIVPLTKASEMLNVLNEAGEVIIGNIRYVYDDSSRTLFSFPGDSLLSVEVFGKNNDITTNFDQVWRIGGPSSISGSDDIWIQDPCQNSRHRISGKAVFRCAYSQKSIRPIFFLEVKAQKRKWGAWDFRNDYKAFWGADGEWKYTVYLSIQGSGDSEFECPPNSLNGASPTSPYAISNVNSNHSFRFLDPTGRYSIPSFVGATYRDNIKLSDLRLVLRFSGCSSGYSFTLQ